MKEIHEHLKIAEDLLAEAEKRDDNGYIYISEFRQANALLAQAHIALVAARQGTP